MERFYGYGIVDKDGKHFFDEFCVSGSPEELQMSVDGMNNDEFEDHPYRVVELFYKDEQS